jgi:hypothetical protein
MIPAILSAVFVIYLYKTLNLADLPNEIASQGSPENGAAINIAARLSDLQKRIERVAAEVTNRGGKR